MTSTETRRDKRSIAVAVQDSLRTLIAGLLPHDQPWTLPKAPGWGECTSFAGYFESPIEWSLRLPWVMLKVSAH